MRHIALSSLKTRRAAKFTLPTSPASSFNLLLCRCTDYAHRRRKVHDCIKLTPAKVRTLRLVAAVLRLTG